MHTHQPLTPDTFRRPVTLRDIAMRDPRASRGLAAPVRPTR